MTASYGFQSQLGIDTATPVTQRFDFQSEGLICDENFIDTNGMRGTRSRSQERIRQGNRHVHGQIKFQPTTNELALLLPWFLGGSPSGSGTVTYPLADALSSRYVVVDRVAKVFTYNGCVVDRATIRASEGQALELDLDIVGIDEAVGNSGTFPGLSLDLATPPLIFTDLALSIASTTYNCKSFELTISNDIDKERFFNSQTLTSGYAKDRHVTISHPLPYGDSTATYNTGVGGVAVVATFTDGSHVLTLTMANVKYPRKSPQVAGRQEVMLPLQGTAYKSGSTLELVTTLAA